ncbi:glycosyl-transferase for dystroglycan-domain-containing protein [Jimgerdemannia flammicorona]|uniref:Glycosyl-transferase for dystroglycan-domain-containing protein n=2 Tax=Jimgerdemannia flammicorona TaxID=994334 RepID=A0A432ZYM7_9FUNG|nr:glycosyl-transferase for dystroglycan-domain-containing protein [Jimgerdemannia flammicorona]
MPEDFLLAKVFSDAMGPSKVIPYYYKAEKTPNPEDITITTLVTANRFPVLSRLVTHYQGPISVAIHINDDEGRDAIIEELHQLYKSNPLMRQYMDLHLIVDTFDRQFNMWRNVAKFFARSEYIMMLDVDFHLCTDFRMSIIKNPRIMEMLRAGNTALVVPAFEFIKQEDGLDWQTFPTGKKDLLDIVRSEKIDMFHRTWVKGHGATNYTKWYQATELYKVTDYIFSYEPYIIYKKEGSPW